jgi:hypothetical protein
VWFTLGSGSHATEKLNSWGSIYVNFS